MIRLTKGLLKNHMSVSPAGEFQREADVILVRERYGEQVNEAIGNGTLRQSVLEVCRRGAR